MKFTLLSGGTGGPKLLDGLVDLPRLDPGDVSVVVNTGDDVEISGNFICPDLDAVLYSLAGWIDQTDWFGIEGDTFRTHRAIRDRNIDVGDRPYLPEPRQNEGREIARGRRLSGAGEFMRIGDRDRATHILRTSLLDRGLSLTEATQRLRRGMGIESRVLPMSNQPVSTMVRVRGEELLHFQEFWVLKGGEPGVKGIRYRGGDTARASDPVRGALQQPVIIGPANPISSLGPILSLQGVREALEATSVVVVSPFLGQRAFSGPAKRFMEAMGFEGSTAGLAEYCGDMADVFVLDRTDPTEVDVPTRRTDIGMDHPEDRTRLARFLLDTLGQAI